MNFTQTILFFGIPGVAVCLGLYLGVPLAVSHGIPLIVGWTTALWLPVVLLVGWVLLKDSRQNEADSFPSRFRFRKLEKRHWIVILGTFFLLQVCEVFLSKSGAVLAGTGYFPLPPVIPELFDPSFDVASGLETFLGVPVAGNWWLVLFWLGWLIINIGGEELLWRGYALPRQERVFGKYAWLVNGLCWNLVFHAFMWWNYVTLMPISMAVPYLVQRYQNTWIGVCIHGFGNLLVLVILIPSIAGWI